MKTAIIEKCIALLIVIGEIICKFLETRNSDSIQKASMNDVDKELSMLTDFDNGEAPREFA
jgi:hypothetical protein